VTSGGSVWPWNSAVVISLLTLGSVFFVAFLFIEWKVASLQMLPLRLFTSLSRVTLFMQNFLFGFVWQADLYFLPIYYQDVRGYSPIRSALLQLPLLLMQSAGGVISGPMMSFLARSALSPICCEWKTDGIIDTYPSSGLVSSFGPSVRV
jgi:hypothetical protein